MVELRIGMGMGNSIIGRSTPVLTIPRDGFFHAEMLHLREEFELPCFNRVIARGTMDVVETIKEIKKLPEDSPGYGTDGKKRPDLVVLGGGAWDKLWKYNTKEEQGELKKGLGELVGQMKMLV